MAKEDHKPIRLIPIDEVAKPPASVVRLTNSDPDTTTAPAPIRLGKWDGDPQLKRRLELPSRDEVELRTHQPGIEALIETENYTAESLEEEWNESEARHNPVPWGWFVLLGLLLTGAVIWSLTRVKKSEVVSIETAKSTELAIEQEKKEISEAEVTIDRIDRMLRSYFSCTGVEELIHHVRHPERVGPLMRDYYKNKPVFSGLLKSVKLLQPLTLANRGDFWKATVTLSNGKSQSLIIQAFESEDPKVDWETLVCYQPMPWDDFVNQRPQGTSIDFRVMVESDSFYSHEFADSNKWKSFRLTTLGSEETLFGYTSLDNEITRQLLAIIQQNGGKQTCLILRLNIPTGIKSHRGVVIEKILSPRWIYMDHPDSKP